MKTPQDAFLRTPQSEHDARKREPSPDLGWSCVWSFVLILVTGSVSLGFALMRFGARGPDGHHLVDIVPDDELKSWPPKDRDRDAQRAPPSSGAFNAAVELERLPTTTLPNSMDHANAPGFFFDIGASSSAVRGSKRSQLLEKKGWSGICAVPYPGDFSSRSCRVVALPVSGISGEKVQVQDCSERPAHTFAGLIRTLQKDTTCPEVEANTVGIVDLLSLSAAPPVIDYIALDTHGSELEILEQFPFSDFCARSWTVKHNYDSHLMERIRSILEVAHGCRVREGAGEYWARCICEKNTKQIGQPSRSANDRLEMRPDGNAILRE